jgi:DNA repair exonuclease SbcCD ATPase subunit
MLTIKSIRFKNFLSYGEQLQGYEFSRGLTTISAPSGYGKSVLLEALSYVLYGQPYRDIKLDDMINRVNKGGMAVECEFETGGQSYKVSRGRKPDLFSIEKNGAKMDKASSSALTQDSLTKIIGIDFDMFKRVLCISTVNNSPFLDSSKESKRKAKDQLFNLETLGAMLKKAKDEATPINTLLSVSENTLDIAESELEKASLALAAHEEKVKTFETDKEAAIQSLKEKIAEAEASVKSGAGELKKKEERKAEIKKKMEKLDVKEASQKESELKAARMELKSKLARLGELAAGGEGVCEACGQKITAGLIKGAKQQMAEAKKEIEALDSEIAKTQETKERHSEGTELLRDLEAETIKLNASLEGSEKAIAALKEQAKTEKSREYPDADSARKRMKEAEASVKRANAECESAKAKKALNKEVQKILGDDGVKKVIIASILPMFNELIALNCQRFGLPMLVEFNEKMDEIIKECGLEYPYKGCSEGEKARLNLAIQMAMLEISRAISGWDCNLIVLDEILDNSLDVGSIIKIVNCLKERCLSNGSNAIVISHKLADNHGSLFDKVYRIDKSLGFSMIRGE